MESGETLPDPLKIRQIKVEGDLMAAKVKGRAVFDRLRKSQEGGAASVFVIINGLIVSVAAFIALYFVTGDLKSQEARNLTRDVVRVTQQTIAGLEQFTESLAQYLAQAPDMPDDRVVTLLQQGLPELRPVNHLLWLTEQQTWYRRSLDDGEIVGRESDVEGLPTWADLKMAARSVQAGKVGLLTTVPWVAFAGAGSEMAERPVGFVFAQKTAGGGMGYLLAVTRPSRVFSGALNIQRDDLAGIAIGDQDSGVELLAKRYVLSGQKGSRGAEEVAANYVLEMGGHLWRLDFSVYPTSTTVLLSLLPWIVPSLTAFLSLLAAFLMHKKARRDSEMAKISRTLEGTSHELQSKISERDRLFTALKKSEREHRALINCISEVIFETDAMGRLIFLNDTWQRVTDIEADKALRRPLFDMLAPEDQAEQRGMFEDLLAGQRQSYRSETKIKVASGHYKPVELAFSMIRLGEDQSVHAVGTITDIEKRRQAEEAVRLAEHKYREIVENAVSGLYQTTPDGTFLSANPALAEILGYGGPEDLMRSVSDLGRQIYASAADRQKFVSLLERDGKVTELESELCRKDGGRVWVVENARVVCDDQGRILYYEGSLWDITARKKSDAALREARMQAEVSSRARMDFIANMSHELRTPLNVIIGFAEVIKNEIMGPIGTKAYQEYAKDIYESGNNLLKIISDILEVSKIESGQRELKESAFKLKNTLKSCMVILASRLEAAGHALSVDIPDDFPELVGEELGVKQMLINLIGNAIKFTPKGGRVRVSGAIDVQGRMIVEIHDNGAGMTGDEIRRALQPFGQVETDLARDNSGTGLGLTIVQSLIKLHGGSFELESEKGKGTVARLIFPKARVFVSAKKRALGP